MDLYKIDDAILDCVDGETGEIIDVAALEALKMERDTKIENIALWIKNLLSDAEQIKAENLSRYLSLYLNGKKFHTPKVSISFRKSEVLDIFDIKKLLKTDNADSYLKYVEPTPDKTAIKQALKSGVKIPGCSLVEKNNIQIK